MYLCTFCISGYILLYIISSLVMWIILDYDPYFVYIDACLDLGGVWNDETKDCEKSELYNKWKQRTWF
jgi:hypothetical protein